MFYFILFLIFLFGLAIGSFINCLAWRLHKKKTIFGRSMCPKCREKIAWYDNIPVFSFLILHGRCRHCRKQISWEYPAVEFAVGVLFVVGFINNFQFPNFPISQFPNFPISNILNFDFILLTFKNWFLIAVLILIFIYDLKYYLILDIITLPASAIVFGLNLILGVSWQNLLISGIIGAGFFLFQFLISGGKWIGGGDIRLGLLMGFALGWPEILAAIFLAYIIGSLIGLYLLATKKKTLSAKVPLGVFLSPATLIVLFWGEELISWYLSLLMF